MHIESIYIFCRWIFFVPFNTCKRKLSENKHTVELQDEMYVDSEIEFSIPVREALSKLKTDFNVICGRGL